MIVLDRYQTTYEDDKKRVWYTEKYIIENLGPYVDEMKASKDLILGITHKMCER